MTDSEGARGEIVIGGAHVAKEYYNLPDKTEEEFFEDAGKRWFKTGFCLFWKFQTEFLF